VPGCNSLRYRHPDAKHQFANPFQAKLGIQEFVSLDAPPRHFVPDKLATSWFGFGSADFSQNLIGFRVEELNNKTESFWQSLPFN
jgi:hypothetical protein